MTLNSEGKQRRLIFLAVAVLVMAGLSANCGKTPPKEPTIIAWSEAKQLSSEKLLIYLKSLLSSNQRQYVVAFYQAVLESTEGKDRLLFRQALAEAGNALSLVYIGPAVQDWVISFSHKLRQSRPDITDEQVETISKEEGARITKLINLFLPEIKRVAERETVPLIAHLKTEFRSEKEPSAIKLVGPLMGIKALGEKGFELVLASIENEQDTVMASILLGPMGSHAVIPLLKAYENPVDSKQKTAAGTLIFMLPMDNVEVLDKVVEAYKHGRYLPVSVGKKNKDGKTVIGLKDAISMAMSYWGPLIEGANRGKKPVIENIAKRHLADPNGQSKVIGLLANLDFQMAVPYLEQLDPAGISDESVKALFFACYPPIKGISLSGEPYLEERCQFFCFFFPKCRAEQRKEALYGIDGYPAEMMARFFINNFSVFTDEEKTTAIFACGKFPVRLRDEVFNRVRPKCNAEQKGIISYVVKKGVNS